MPKRAEGTGEGKRAPLNMRTTPELRDRLEAASVLSGRSLAQEVEARLERSLVDESQLGGPYLAALSRMVISAVQITEHLTGKSWLDDIDTRSACCAAITECVSSFDKGPLSREGVLRSRLRSDQVVSLAAKAKAAASVALHEEKLRGTALLSRALSGDALIKDETEKQALLALVETIARAHPGGAAGVLRDLASHTQQNEPPLVPEMEEASELEAEILDLSGKNNTTRKHQAAWDARVLEWARTYPGGLQAARDQLVNDAKRAESDGEPGDFELWLATRKVDAGDAK